MLLHVYYTVIDARHKENSDEQAFIPDYKEHHLYDSYCPHPGIGVNRMNHSEHYPPHSSMAVTTERSQVHTLQSKHDPSVGGNSRRLSVWVCQTQKPRLIEPSSCPPTHLPKGDQHQSVGGTAMTQLHGA